MNIAHDDARQSLDLIQATQGAVHRAFNRQSARIVLAWGTAYLLGPLAMALWPMAGIACLELFLAGAIGFTIFETSRKSLATGRSSWQFGVSWGVLYLFGMLWFVILSPYGVADLEHDRFGDVSQNIWAYGVTLAMFAYVLMGLWMGRIYVIIAVLVTGFVLIGRFLIHDPTAFWIWSGLSEGGTLLAGGLVLLRSASKPANAQATA